MELDNYDIKLLTELYEEFSQGHVPHVNLEKWGSQHEFDRDYALKQFTRLNNSELTEAAAVGPVITITTDGIIYVEEQCWSPEYTATHRSMRNQMLLAGLAPWEEHGKFGLASFRDIEEHFPGEGESTYIANLRFLSEVGMIEHSPGQQYSLTSYGGVPKAQWISQAVALGNRFEELRNDEVISPQKRGKALEKLLEELAQFHGMVADRNVLSVGEENDLILSEHFHHFVVSCKWEKKRAKSEYLDIVRNRIAKRPGSLGLIVSIGGFGKDIISEAENNTSLGLVVFFGKGDVEDLFRNARQFGELLLERHTELVRHRKIVFKD
jgi:hypothetical protein